MTTTITTTTGSTTVLSERAWQQQVTDLAALCGWRWYHTQNSRRSPAGFPDLTLVRGGRLVFAELKTERGRVTTAQQAWLDALGHCQGVLVFVWRPADFAEVLAVLR